MVGLKRLAVVFLSIFCLVILATPISAQNMVSGKIDFSTGVLVSEKINSGGALWFAGGSAKIQLDTPSKNAVRASIAAQCNLSSLSLQSISVPSGMNALFAQEIFTLERAFIKIRLPWVLDSSMRLSIGKMPLSWSYGQYFNAGDIIFGAKPIDGSSFDPTDFRASTAWMMTLQMPFADFFFTEFAVLPYFPSLNDLVLGAEEANGGNFSETLKKANSEGRYGARFVFQPRQYALDSVETGILTRGDASATQVYLAVDGTLGADYNLSGSVEVLSAEQKTIDGKSVSRAEHAKNTAAFSAALFYTITFTGDTRDFPLTLRAETLYYPFAEAVDAYAMASLSCTDNLSVLATYLYNNYAQYVGSTKHEHTVSAALVWLPVKGLQLAVQGSLFANDPAKLSSVSLRSVYAF